MRKLNPPTYRTRVIKVLRPVVEIPGHEGEWRVMDERGEYDDWVSPASFLLNSGDPITGRRMTIRQCLGARPYGFFKAQRAEGEWRFKRFLPHTHYNW